jgi:hypothetical protein
VSSFSPGTIFDNVDKFANSLGYENAGIVLSLSLIPWDSVEDRDAFIQAITQELPRGGNNRIYRRS